MGTMAQDTKNTGKDVEPESPRKGFFHWLTNLPQFYAEVQQERRKVTWPTIAETRVTTIAVFVMILMAVVFFAAVDWSLSTLVRFVLNAV